MGKKKFGINDKVADARAKKEEEKVIRQAKEAKMKEDAKWVIEDKTELKKAAKE